LFSPDSAPAGTVSVLTDDSAENSDLPLRKQILFEELLLHLQKEAFQIPSAKERVAAGTGGSGTALQSSLFFASALTSCSRLFPSPHNPLLQNEV
jgi:hypothetical protein